MIAFDGQVTFTCTRPNLRVQIAQDLLKSAVPEWVKFPKDGDAARIFDNLAAFLGRTTSITFALDSALTPEIAAFRDFWALAQDSADYRAIWDAFILLNLEVHNEWMEALNQTIPGALSAPPELQVEASENGDPNPHGRRLSKPSTPKSKPSPTMSKNPSPSA